MNNNKSRQFVQSLKPGDVFVNTATRHTVLAIRTAEMSHPTNQRYMDVTTEAGTLKIPATLLVTVIN